MIKTWFLNNFKSVFDQPPIEFAPLTLFAGANSSGKSTVLQSLLLTTQTLQSPVQSRPVVLNGNIVTLGAFDDILTNGTNLNEISIGFEFSLSPTEVAAIYPSITRGPYYRPRMQLIRNLSSVSCNFTFSADSNDGQDLKSQLHPRLERSSIKANANRDGKVIDESIVITRSNKGLKERAAQYHLDEDNGNPELQSLIYEVKSPDTIKNTNPFYGVPHTGNTAGALLTHFLPSRLSIVYDKVEEETRNFLSFLLGELYYRDLELDQLQFTNNRLLKSIIKSIFSEVAKYTDLSERNAQKFATAIARLDQNFTLENIRGALDIPLIKKNFEVKVREYQEPIESAVRGDRVPAYTMAYVPMTELCDFAANYIQQYFSRCVKYLGPLRDDPKSMYPLAGSIDPKDVGLRGEHTAAVLDVHRNSTIQYIPSSCFVNTPVILSPSSATLGEAVSDWLQYMGVVTDVQTIDRGKLGHELKVSTPGSRVAHDLTHVGVGVSQVLPILVLCLLAESGSTLILEQPELHLHPRVQTRLADFFIAMTKIGKQCVVETHSEYLVNRLRYQVAISEKDTLSENINIFFVKKKENQSQYRLIRINRFGVIEDWPEGFFDETENIAASVLRAGMSKRKKETVKKDA